ncbi:hypothetical protein K505DRAFT_346114 [Melanomma pulvis-pyrius CBS 109.77]|uniref:Uncharacterized protein n=1 Tax=Melanomma pulvis-pyrius CBS 109.77 TaxID=1314802 RepID=A0A6A6XRN6_9PLEO|nr:hypothetical protein K505DRAFT_346114 [Melanomma pulvis-pyrius CBS 109.77]
MEMQVPIVRVDDLRLFHTKHFPHAPAPAYFVYGAGSVEQPWENEEEDDGLGYYNDGIKRTLTDEQVALFRHTEIQTIIRQRMRRREASSSPEPKSKRPSASSHQTPSDPQQATASGDQLQNARVEKQTNWTKTGTRTKAKNRKSRKRHQASKREGKKKKRDEDEESDEWDPWHQATGPDAQKDTPIDLDY